MITYWRIPVSVTLRTPWVTPGDAAPGPSTDIVLARNRAGAFILPATLIKGNLRAAADAVVRSGALDPTLRDDCFGLGSGERADAPADEIWRTANEPDRGALIFGDLVADRGATQPKGRTQRVEIDDELGAALEGHLLFVECPFGFGDEVTFSGDVILTNAGKVSPGDARTLLRLALGRLFAIGGMKSIGFGRVLRTDIGEPMPVTVGTVAPPGLRLAMTYKIDRPFIVDASRHSGNMSVGSDVISGSAIKAIIARGCKAAGMDAAGFISALSVGHAHPGGRKTPPLSLSTCDGRVFCHLGGQARPGHHVFAPDWKDEGNAVRTVLGQGWETPTIAYSGRTRTAIEDGGLTAKYETGEDGDESGGLLFSQIAVVPDQLVWTGEIKAPTADAPLSEVLGMLEAGLPGLGKTGAVLTGQAQKAPPIPLLNPEPDGDLNLCLTTDACLFAPDQVADADIKTLYEAYFRDHGFELKSWFARQRLKGGYLALRYPADPTRYAPWVLTTAGSVFRVTPTESADVADVLNNGLPLARGLSGDWRQFPFLRENGFGHVTHNIVDHRALAGGMGP